MIKNLLDELQTTWDFGPEELADIKDKMVSYAIASCFDSQVRDEAYKLSAKQE